VTTFSKAFTVKNSFLKKSMTVVTAVDLDLDLNTFEDAMLTLQGKNHYFLLDMNENVFMHSKVKYIKRENIPIENIEFGVNSTDDIVPDGLIKNNETE
jgi:hypothetical protein